MNLPAFAFLKKDTQVLVSQRTTFVGRRSMSNLDEISEDYTTDLFIQNKNRMAFTTLLGTGFALSGFILQNLGTRELHFSASIAQLIATLALTILRSWVRRNVGIPPPDCKKLKRGFEMTHMIYELCGIRRFTDYAKCSIPRTADGPRSQLRIDSSTTPFIGIHPEYYQTYARRLLLSHVYLGALDLAPGQDRFLLDKATKAIAFLNGLGFSTHVVKRILFCGKTLDPRNTDNMVDSECSEGSMDLSLSLIQVDNPSENLTALWSFCFCDYYQSSSEINFRLRFWAFHIVAVVSNTADHSTKLKLLGQYIGNHNFIAWQMGSDNNYTRLDGYFTGSPEKDAWALFGLHYLRENTSYG